MLMRRLLCMVLCFVTFWGCTPAGPSGSVTEGPSVPSGSQSASTLAPTQTPTTQPDPLKDSCVSFTPPPAEVALYNQVRVFIEDTPLPLYDVKVNNSQTWPPDDEARDSAGVGYFTLEGNCRIRIEKEGMGTCTVRPLSAGVQVACADGVAEFTLSSSGNYAIEPSDDPKQAIFLFVSKPAQEAAPVGKVIRFSKGLHTSENNPNIKNNTVTLASNTTVILEEGAVVRARFVANNAENVSIIGRGIIDGSAFPRNVDKGQVTVPLDFNKCRNVTFRDFSVLDPAGWCVNWYFCKDSVIEGIKIISSRANGDGISIQSCQNIQVRNCFLRTWDDSLVVKNYPDWQNRNIEGETRHILFENCSIWTDLAQSMEIGYETVGEAMEDITFRNMTVLHNFHKPVMSIHNGNNAHIRNVLFDTITVEDASVVNQSLCEFSVAHSATWSDQHKVTGLGSIDGVRVKNVTVLKCAASMAIRLSGSVDTRSGYGNSVHRVSNVVFENVWMKNRHITEDKLRHNKYAESQLLTGQEKVLCPFLFDVHEVPYKAHAKVTVNK